MKNKLAELLYLENLVKKKISEDERKRMRGRIFAQMICSLAKNLVRDAGYKVATTIIKREIRKVGRNDANHLMELLGLKEKTVENASRILKVAAMILGLRLDAVGSETIIRECPQGMEAIKLNEPLMCNVCLEYCNGIIESVVGIDYKIERTKCIVNGDEYCMFRIVKR